MTRIGRVVAAVGTVVVFGVVTAALSTWTVEGPFVRARVAEEHW